MVEMHMEKGTYRYKNGDADIGIMELNSQEESYVKKVAEIILPRKHELLNIWADIFFKHFTTQKGISMENELRDSENLAIQTHVVSLVNDFTEYLIEGDIEGYIGSNVGLGKRIAKEDLSFEKIVFGFHFLEDAYDFLLTQHFQDNTKLIDVIKALNKLHHNTFATIAKEYFYDKNQRINLLRDSQNKIVLGLVHDVRDKLSFGKTLPDLYLSGIFEKNPEKLDYYMKLLKEIMEEALGIITDALDYGKVIDGSYQLKIEPTDLVDVVRRIVEPFLPILDAENKWIYINGLPYTGGPVGEKVIAKVDPKQITRVFANLFSNAVKYTKERVEFLIEDHDKEFYCAVRDNGVGIPKENQQKIFKSGITAIPVLGDQIEMNSGVGIDAIKRIVTLHKGTIGLDSKAGVGTTFYFNLPKEIGDIEA